LEARILDWTLKRKPADGPTHWSTRKPTPDTADNGSHMERWKKIPLFLWLKAIPLPT
jgi:hypothetical protein